METSERGGAPEFPACQAHSPLLFAVLVPHRDCLPALETYRRNLFASGFDGAYSFPAAAPLALLRRPLESGELKSAAAELRKLLGDRKIVSIGIGQGECCGAGFSGDSSNELRFFGLRLDVPLPAFPGGAVILRWEKPILAPAVMYGPQGHERRPAIRPLAEANPSGMDSLSRAAALANLALTQIPEADYSFTWKMGPLFWLPKHKPNGRLKD